MKKICIQLFSLIVLTRPTQIQSSVKKRENYYSSNHYLGSISTPHYGSSHLIQEPNPYQNLNNHLGYNFEVTLSGQSPHQSIPISRIPSNPKPVYEPTIEYMPSQMPGSAIIPQIPPPATPVNAAASNVPARQGAVFLGSGSIGVVSLGNGAYALGSGSLGYSENRRQPRPSLSVPLYPPLPASPNLIPAAAPSAPQPPPPIIPNIQYPPNYPIDNSLNNNGYEYLPPDRVGFGSPPQRPPQLRVTQQFATPTAQNPPPLQPQYLQQFQISTDNIQFSRSLDQSNLY